MQNRKEVKNMTEQETKGTFINDVEPTVGDIRFMGTEAASSIIRRDRFSLTELSSSIVGKLKNESVSTEYKGIMEGILNVTQKAINDKRMLQMVALPLPRPEYPQRIEKINATIEGIKEDSYLSNERNDELISYVVDTILDEDLRSAVTLSHGLKDASDSLYYGAAYENPKTRSKDLGKIEGMLGVIYPTTHWLAPRLSENNLEVLGDLIEAQRDSGWRVKISREEFTREMEAFRQHGLINVLWLDKENTGSLDAYISIVPKGQKLFDRYHLSAGLAELHTICEAEKDHGRMIPSEKLTPAKRALVNQGLLLERKLGDKRWIKLTPRGRAFYQQSQQADRSE